VASIVYSPSVLSIEQRLASVKCKGWRQPGPGPDHRGGPQQGGPKHAADMKRILESFSRLEDRLQERSLVEKETTEILDEINRAIVDAGGDEITGTIP